LLFWRQINSEHDVIFGGNPGSATICQLKEQQNFCCSLLFSAVLCKHPRPEVGMTFAASS
jgi:hypothetical protein